MYDVIGFKKEKMFDDFGAEENKQDPKKLAEKDFLEMFNRIRCAIFAKPRWETWEPRPSLNNTSNTYGEHSLGR